MVVIKEAPVLQKTDSALCLHPLCTRKKKNFMGQFLGDDTAIRDIIRGAFPERCVLAGTYRRVEETREGKKVDFVHFWQGH